MNSWGEDCPTSSDIIEFGLMYACQRTNGNFALYYPGRFAARGRSGTSPLYWNRDTGEFSFKKNTNNLYEFPRGHLYNVEQDRLVCWDSLYYDRPMDTVGNAFNQLVKLLDQAIDRFEYDAIAYDKVRIQDDFVPSYHIDEFPYEEYRNKTVLCNLWYEDLFRDSLNYDPKNVTEIADKFASYDVQIWSPFCDKAVLDFVLDTTLPSDRPLFLDLLLE